jgi:hypothetical protein
MGQRRAPWLTASADEQSEGKTSRGHDDVKFKREHTAVAPCVTLESYSNEGLGRNDGKIGEPNQRANARNSGPPWRDFSTGLRLSLGIQEGSQSMATRLALKLAQGFCLDLSDPLPS